jgi:hypothetical protein
MAEADEWAAQAIGRSRKTGTRDRRRSA